jgi:zinc protease
MRSLQDNGYWLRGLQSSLIDGTDPARLLTIEDEVKGLTAEDVARAARRYVDTNNYVQVVLNPDAQQMKTAKAGGE